MPNVFLCYSRPSLFLKVNRIPKSCLSKSAKKFLKLLNNGRHYLISKIITVKKWSRHKSIVTLWFSSGFRSRKMPSTSTIIIWRQNSTSCHCIQMVHRISRVCSSSLLDEEHTLGNYNPKKPVSHSSFFDSQMCQESKAWVFEDDPKSTMVEIWVMIKECMP